MAPQNGETDLDADADHKCLRNNENVRQTNVKSEKPPLAAFFSVDLRLDGMLVSW